MAKESPITLQLPGPSLRFDDADELRNLINNKIEESNGRLVLDCSLVSFLDSSFMGLLLSLMKRCRSKGGDLKLASPTEPVLTVLKLVSLDRVMSINDTIEDAIAAFDS